MQESDVCRASGGIRKEIFLRHAKIYLKNRFPDTLFKLALIRYVGGKSLKVTWKDGPEEKSLQDFVETFQGASIHNTVITRSDTLISFPHKTIYTSWGIDFIILKRT